MTEKFKKIIFDKLYKDLKHVEIILYDKSIWFIDREKRFWILELTLDGKLWWRTNFFNDFFSLFSMVSCEFEMIICEWVEQVLNCKVETSDDFHLCNPYKIDKILGYKVKKSGNLNLTQSLLLDELLKYEELRPIRLSFDNQSLVDMALSINTT